MNRYVEQAVKQLGGAAPAELPTLTLALTLAITELIDLLRTVRK